MAGHVSAQVFSLLIALPSLKGFIVIVPNFPIVTSDVIRYKYHNNDNISVFNYTFILLDGFFSVINISQ